MPRIDTHASQFRRSLVRVEFERDAAHGVAVYLEDAEVLDTSLDFAQGAPHQFVAFHRRLDQGINSTTILLARPADRLVFVGMNQCADAFIGEYLREKALLEASADDVYARHA